MKYRILNLIAVIFLVAGIILGYPSFIQYWQGRETPTTTSGIVFADKPVKQTNDPLIMGEPNRIVIKSLGIDLPVASGQYYADSKTWELSGDKAHFASLSVASNNKTGNTLIYGHNNKQVFYSLNQIRPGAEVSVFTTNGKVFKYKFTTAAETSPNDSSVFNYKGPAMLTLQTCSGLWYQNRQLFAFELVEVTNA